MKRRIIEINEALCTGCGDCIPNCPEGAIQIIDDKARLISDLFCDGLGACLGHCPVGAITVTEREADPYDERIVMENIIRQGNNVIRAHLRHLEEHGEKELLSIARNVLEAKGINIEPAAKHTHQQVHSGCPGSRAVDLSERTEETYEETGRRASQLRQWPVQMHLISPGASYFHKKDLLLAADCVAYAAGDFHKDFLKGKQLVIACPKLDDGQEVYLEKITALVDQTQINTLTVMIMEVPCCSGLLRLAQEGVNRASRKIPVKCIVVGIQGNILKEDWV